MTSLSRVNFVSSKLSTCYTTTTTSSESRVTFIPPSASEWAVFVVARSMHFPLHLGRSDPGRFDEKTFHCNQDDVCTNLDFWAEERQIYGQTRFVTLFCTRPRFFGGSPKIRNGLTIESFSRSMMCLLLIYNTHRRSSRVKIQMKGSLWWDYSFNRSQDRRLLPISDQILFQLWLRLWEYLLLYTTIYFNFSSHIKCILHPIPLRMWIELRTIYNIRRESKEQ